MGLAMHDHRGAVELAFSHQPEARDRVPAWYVPGVLVDAGGAHTAGQLADWLSGRALEALLLGHHHEDHCAGAIALVECRSVPVYGSRGTAARLRRPAPVPEYRARLWGQRRPLRVRSPAGVPLVAVRRLAMLPTSSATLTRAPAGSSLATWYSGAASAWPCRGGPVGDDGFAASHRGLIEDPAPVLHEQLDYLEDLATGIAHLRAAGFGVSAIAHELFGGEAVAPGGTATWRDLSSGEFSSARWVRAFLRRDGALSAL